MKKGRLAFKILSDNPVPCRFDCVTQRVLVVLFYLEERLSILLKWEIPVNLSDMKISECKINDEFSQKKWYSFGIFSWVFHQLKSLSKIPTAWIWIDTICNNIIVNIYLIVKLSVQVDSTGKILKYRRFRKRPNFWFGPDFGSDFKFFPGRWN